MLAWLFMVVVFVGSFAAPLCSAQEDGGTVWAAGNVVTAGNGGKVYGYRGGKIWNRRSLGARPAAASAGVEQEEGRGDACATVAAENVMSSTWPAPSPYVCLIPWACAYQLPLNRRRERLCIFRCVNCYYYQLPLNQSTTQSLFTVLRTFCINIFFLKPPARKSQGIY
jgi:hypothetical protein